MHRPLFQATVIVLGFALAAGIFGQTPEPSPGDAAQTKGPQYIGQGLDLLWWFRR